MKPIDSTSGLTVSSVHPGGFTLILYLLVNISFGAYLYFFFAQATVIVKSMTVLVYLIQQASMTAVFLSDPGLAAA